MYEDDVAPLLPVGTLLKVTAWYDNTARNPRVVDHRNWKGYGNRSIDDMFLLLSRFVPMTDEQFKEEVAVRQAKQLRSADRAAAAVETHLRNASHEGTKPGTLWRIFFVSVRVIVVVLVHEPFAGCSSRVPGQRPALWARFPRLLCRTPSWARPRSGPARI